MRIEVCQSLATVLQHVYVHNPVIYSLEMSADLVGSLSSVSLSISLRCLKVTYILRKPVDQIISVNSIMTKHARNGARLTAICRLRSSINNYGFLSSINSNSTTMTG